jgi:ribosome biogenesis GTPase
VTAALGDLGWTPALAGALAALGDPALHGMRVILSERGAYRVSDGEEEVSAGLPGRMRHRTATRDLPAVGDWVAVRRGRDATLIEAVLPRTSVLARRDPDQKSEQVLVANVDRALLVMGLDHDFNLRRLERYLTLVASGGVAPVIVLSKADLDPARAPARRDEVVAIARDAPVLAENLLAPGGGAAVVAELAPRSTAVLLGSSGAGKSTLLNLLAGGDLQRTAPVRMHDSRGRHTTTRRQLFRLPGGALVIDTPGLRELEPWQAAAGLDDSFADIATAATGCRFRDCSHRDEPDCAVHAAVAAGALPADRLAAYHKLETSQRPRRR